MRSSGESSLWSGERKSELIVSQASSGAVVSLPLLFPDMHATCLPRAAMAKHLKPQAQNHRNLLLSPSLEARSLRSLCGKAELSLLDSLAWNGITPTSASLPSRLLSP